MSEQEKPVSDPEPGPDAPPQDHGWDEEWGEEVYRDDGEQAWEEDDTSDEDTDWEDEDLLEENFLDGDAANWAPTEGDWEEDLEWSDELEREPDFVDPLDDLPETPTIVGWKTAVDLPAFEVAEIPARCSTDCPTSTFHVEVREGQDGTITLCVNDRVLEVPVIDESGELVVRLELLVAARSFALDLRIRATSGAPLLVLGRDALAGRFLIDVAG